ncbi:N-6 DNA methylase [Nocardiopsis rhodophaea]
MEHGEVFTRSWIVDLILDLVGYTADRDLARLKIAEPACGAGAFLSAIAKRLSESCRAHRRDLSEAAQAVRAFDLLPTNVETSRNLVRAQLLADGWQSADVEDTVRSWIRQGDYLLEPEPREGYAFVVGNPPYLRLEDVPRDRTAAYRAACPTMGGRADVYVGFYEKALRSLAPGGALGFICADRWMHNQYGSHLREFVTSGFSVDFVLTMHDVDAFEEAVAAYPAITVISRKPQGTTVAADAGAPFQRENAAELLRWSQQADSELIEEPSFQAVRLPHWFTGSDFWPASSPARLAMLEYLTDHFPVLEDRSAGTRVGIGIATGADKVFVTDNPELVEHDRLLPLSMVKDIKSGTFHWGGKYLVNPWTPSGELVDLADYPRLRAYFAAHSEALRKRHIATKQPDRWYKTIDKVSQSLIGRPKLLLPDMKTTIHPVLDEGGFYPHHNLYYIVSDTWDLRVLGGLMISRVAQAFVEAYAVRMRGGTLRFQAQYLRKIRLPEPSHIDAKIQKALADAFERRDVDAATDASLSAYGMDHLPD